MIFRSLVSCGVAFLLLMQSRVLGGEEVTYDGTPPPHGVAMLAAREPLIDGVLRRGEWEEAQVIQVPPSAGGQGTVARFLWTEKGLYAAFVVQDSTPVFGHSPEGEAIYQEDCVELFVDVIGDHRQFWEIQVDPAGQTYIRNHVLTAPPRLTAEQRITEEFRVSELWRTSIAPPEGFKVACKLDRAAGVWTAEMFLPASFVNRRRGGAPLEPGVWRVNIARNDWALPKEHPNRQVRDQYWASVLPGHAHLSPLAMGYLELKKTK